MCLFTLLHSLCWATRRIFTCVLPPGAHAADVQPVHDRYACMTGRCAQRLPIHNSVTCPTAGPSTNSVATCLAALFQQSLRRHPADNTPLCPGHVVIVHAYNELALALFVNLCPSQQRLCVCVCVVPTGVDADFALHIRRCPRLKHDDSTHPSHNGQAGGTTTSSPASPAPTPLTLADIREEHPHIFR